MITPWEKVQLARDLSRPKPLDFVENLLDEVIELKGDRYFSDDASLRCGIGSFEGMPITFIAWGKAHDLEGNVEGNFGMTSPEGYRKALRLMKQAEKFSRPILAIIDTPGAYPGIGAENRGQGEAIGECIMEMQFLKTPIISLVTGEGGSGGALALSMADKLIMLENAIYSILSPEGFSSIIFKDKEHLEESAQMMKLTSDDLKGFGLVDEIIQEDKDWSLIYDDIRTSLKKSYRELIKEDYSDLAIKRVEKFREIGN